jgi:hypothetical protein
VEPSLLRLDAERRGQSPGQRGQQEAAAVHVGTVGRMVAKVNVRTPVGRGSLSFPTLNMLLGLLPPQYPLRPRG